MISKLKQVLAILLIILYTVTVISSVDPVDYVPNYLRKNNIPDNEKENFRLNDDTRPSHYKIELLLNDVKENTFEGLVEITFQATKAEVNVVVLNADEIEIEEGAVSVYEVTEDEEENDSILEKVILDEKYEKIEFHLKEVLDDEKNYIIKIKYSGKLHDEKEMRGLYKSHYWQDDPEPEVKAKTKKTLYTTHFGQQARRLMPCYDEPDFKATFDFMIHRNTETHPSTSISNAKLKDTLEVAPNHVVDEFETTSKISTYILALVVSEFDTLANGTFEVHARPDAIDQSKYALLIGPQLISSFEKKLNFPYYTDSVTKMAMAAIPDFSAGAMENWGLLIHREVNVLFDEQHGTSAQKQRIALITSHEIAHMWFGDMVTCNWFDATWLNEGFARFFQYEAVRDVQPDMKTDDQFYTATLHQALAADSSSSGHPLTSKDIYDNPEIRSMFSTITYDKGGSILHMTKKILGEEKFYNAIKRYIEKKAFGTAVPNDLFEEFETERDGITKILTSFTLKAGYPVVDVHRQDKTFHFLQKRFLIEPNDDDKTKWTIPVTIITQESDFTKMDNIHIFEEDKALEVKVEESKLKFYLVNTDQFGFYRVNYDKENWKNLRKALRSNFTDIPFIHRAQIIDDLFNLARAGYHTYDFILETIDYIKKEDHYVPWTAFLNGITFIQNRMSDESYKAKPKFDKYLQNLLKAIYEHLGETPNAPKAEPSHLDHLNRINILKWACNYGVPHCVNWANAEFQKVLKLESIPSDTKPAVYCTGLRENSNTWGKLWDMYTTTNFATEKSTILTALGCTKDAKALILFMEKILTEEIRYQDKSSAFASVYNGNLGNIDVALNYILANKPKWGAVMDIVSTLGDLSARFTKVEQFDRLERGLEGEGLSEDQVKKIKEISTINRKQLDWDVKRLPEVKKYVNASVNLQLSIFTIIASFMIKFVLN